MAKGRPSGDLLVIQVQLSDPGWPKGSPSQLRGSPGAAWAALERPWSKTQGLYKGNAKVATCGLGTA